MKLNTTSPTKVKGFFLGVEVGVLEHTNFHPFLLGMMGINNFLKMH
jgi:hypothetical protein